jgi:hypothetical protein
LIQQVEKLVQDLHVCQELYEVVGKLWLRYLLIRENRHKNETDFQHILAEQKKRNVAEDLQPEANAQVNDMAEWFRDFSSEFLPSENMAPFSEEQIGSKKRKLEDRGVSGTKLPRISENGEVQQKSASIAKNLGGNHVTLESDTVPKLSLSLCFCFLGCLLLREPVLLIDLLRLARKGKLPYISAFKDLAETSHLSTSERVIIEGHRVPTAVYLQKQCYVLIETLNLDIPRLPFGILLNRFVRELKLSSYVLKLAKHLYALLYDPCLDIYGNHESGVPQPHIVVPAFILLALKLCEASSLVQSDKTSASKERASGLTSTPEPFSVNDWLVGRLSTVESQPGDVPYFSSDLMKLERLQFPNYASYCKSIFGCYLPSGFDHLDSLFSDIHMDAQLPKKTHHKEVKICPPKDSKGDQEGGTHHYTLQRLMWQSRRKQSGWVRTQEVHPSYMLMLEFLAAYFEESSATLLLAVSWLEQRLLASRTAH